MPLTTNGESYRDFSEPRFFEAPELADIAKIRNPVDKAHAMLAPDTGGSLDIYKFEDGSSATADGLDIITPNNTGVSGRWRRLTQQTVNVLAYGADPTGASSSSTAVAAAITALGTKGGTVFFPRGIYKFNVTITANNIRLLGDSFSNAVHAGDVIYSYFTAADLALPVVTIGGSGWTHGTSIENCQFYGNDVTGLTAVRIKGGAFATFLQRVAFFKFYRCLHIEASGSEEDLYHVFVDNWQMQVGTEANARGIYAKMADGQTPVTLSIFFSNGQMNGPTGAGSFGVELDGLFVDFTNCYCDFTAGKGVKLSKSGSGQLSPYIKGYSSYFDVPLAAELVTVANFTTVPLWESYMRGSLGMNGTLAMSNGVTVDSYWKQTLETSTAYSLQITGEVAFIDYTTRSGTGNTYSNTKRVYASGSTLIVENTAGNVTLAPAGAVNISPTGASGTVALNGGTLGLTITSGASGLVNLTGGFLVIDNNKGVTIKDNAGSGAAALGSDASNNVFMAGHAAGGDVQFFGRHASTAFEFFPATGGTMFAQIDNNTTAQETGLLLRTDGSLKRVTVGAADSGGVGYRLLRVAN